MKKYNNNNSNNNSNNTNNYKGQISFWNVDKLKVSQENPHILRNPEIHQRFYKDSQPVPILSQINSAHARSYW